MEKVLSLDPWALRSIPAPRKFIRPSIRRYPMQGSGWKSTCVVALSLASVGCKGGDLHPYRAGMEWTYRQTFTDGTTREWTNRSWPTESIDGHAYTRFTQSSAEGRAEWFMRKEHGRAFLRPSRSTPERDVGPLAYRVGQTWTIGEPDGGYTRRRVEAFDTLEQEGGAHYHDCARVREERHARTDLGFWVDHTSTQYYCPGVGLTRSVGPGAGSHIELVRLSRFDAAAERASTSSAAAGELSPEGAAAALNEWARQRGGGSVLLQGVREIPAENRAEATIRMSGVPYRDPIFNQPRTTPANLLGSAEFSRYNGRGWVLTRVASGYDLAWTVDVPVP